MMSTHPEQPQQYPAQRSSFAPPPAGSQPAGQPQYAAQPPYPAEPPAARPPYTGPLPAAQPPYAGPPQTAQAPLQPQTPEPRKSWFARHKVLTGLGALVAVAVIGSALSGGDDDAASAVATEDDAVTTQPAAADDADGTEAAAETEEAEAEEAPTETLPGLGDQVRDGKFEFTVTEIEDGVERIGNDFLNTDAQGQFVLVHMTVENIGDEAQYFDGGSQKLIDTEGRTHSADSGAAIYLDDSNSFLNDINPGNSVDGIVVFDVPEGIMPATLELHDSMFSGGVEVTLE